MKKLFYFSILFFISITIFNNSLTKYKVFNEIGDLKYQIGHRKPYAHIQKFIFKLNELKEFYNNFWVHLSKERDTIKFSNGKNKYLLDLQTLKEDTNINDKSIIIIYLDKENKLIYRIATEDEKAKILDIDKRKD